MAPARAPRYLSSSDPIVRLASRLVQPPLGTGDEPGSNQLSEIDTTPRILENDHTEEPNSERAVSTGGLLFAKISTTPKGTDNVAYGNFFWAIDEFASAARDETAGGPLGRVGLLFSAVGLGNYGSALSNRSDKVVGGSLGYQWFLDPYRSQLVLEVGGRKGQSSEIDAAVDT